MRYLPLGSRVLLKVKKLSDKYEGSSIVMADTIKDRETMTQTVGVIADIGPTAKTQYEGFDAIEVGQTVHFQRYGAQRLNSQHDDEFEYWMINSKDIYCIDQEPIENKQEVTNKLETFKG